MTTKSDEQVAIEELEDCLLSMDDEYQTQVSLLPLFQEEATRGLTAEKKRQLAGVLYHIRGHFHDFLWYLANFAPDSKSKQMILRNISEELGGNRMSHEAMYGVFASEFGIDIHQEIIDGEHDLDFVKSFNKEHMIWLASHDWCGRLSAFSAYERLDNIDYINLYRMAEAIGTSAEGLVFFDVHREVTHFQSTLKILKDSWLNQSESVLNGFRFIYQHQLEMWSDLSKLIFSEADNFKQTPVSVASLA